MGLSDLLQGYFTYARYKWDQQMNPGSDLDVKYRKRVPLLSPEPSGLISCSPSLRTATPGRTSLRVATENPENLIGDVSRHIGLCLFGARSQVRRVNHLRMADERVIRRRRLGFVHIDSGRPEAAFIQGGRQRS